MVERELIVTNKHGIHARPASMIVKLSNTFLSSIKLIKGATVADGRSIMDIMMLAALQNSKILIRIDGNDEDKALEAIMDLFKKDFKL